MKVFRGADTGKSGWVCTYNLWTSVIRRSTDTSLLPGEREVLTACAFHYNFKYRPKALKGVTFWFDIISAVIL